MTRTSMLWTLADLPSQRDRRIVVTGASSGLGAIVAHELAVRDAEVVLAVRNPAKGAAAAAEIRRVYPAARLEIETVDVSDLRSVADFTGRLRAGARPIHALVLNAGAGNLPYELTADGVERTFATNVLGHFAMTAELLPLLERAEVPRVVNVGSFLYTMVRGRPRFDDLTLSGTTSPNVAYARSKFATALIATELERRLRATGSRVTSVLAHPGMATTPMHDAQSGPLGKLWMGIMHATISRDAAEGALPLLYAATADEPEAMRFIGFHLRRGDKRIWFDDIAPDADEASAADLWSAVEDVLGRRRGHAPAI